MGPRICTSITIFGFKDPRTPPPKKVINPPHKVEVTVCLTPGRAKEVARSKDTSQKVTLAEASEAPTC